jgi:hypothetical protein
MSGSIQNTTSTQNINGQYQIAPEKTSVSQLPANKAMEALAETMQENIGSTQKIAYRSLSEGTKGLPVYKAIWQGIKNISHNIETFAKNMWNAEKRTQSAFNIADGALAIGKSLKDKEKAEELIQAFKNDPKGAAEMIDALEKRKEAILNQITEWHEKGEIPEEKVAVEGEGEHAGKVGTLKHSGDCGLLLKTALNNLSAVGKLIAACAEEANKIGQQEITLKKDTETYHKYPKLKNFFDTTLRTFTGVRNELQEALRHDLNAILPGTQQKIKEAGIAYEMYNTQLELHKDTLEELQGNIAVKGIQKEIYTVCKGISDILQKFTENTQVEYQKLSEKI